MTQVKGEFEHALLKPEAAGGFLRDTGDRVLATADSARTHAVLRAAGYRVIPVATPEMRKADGALTCLSIVLP